MEQVRGQVRRPRRALPGPVGEAPVGTLEGFELLQRLLHRGTHLRRVHTGQREGVAQIGRQQQRERSRSFLLGAAIGILDEVSRSLAQPDHRGRCQLDVQTAEPRHDVARNRQHLGGRRAGVGGFAIGGDGLGRRQHFDGNDVLEGVGLVADFYRHLDARAADRAAGRLKARFDRPVGANRQRLLPRRGEIEHGRIEALHRHDRGARERKLTGDDRAEERRVADGQEARYVGFIVIGLLMRTSLSPEPKRDARSAATAMMR